MTYSVAPEGRMINLVPSRSCVWMTSRLWGLDEVRIRLICHAADVEGRSHFTGYPFYNDALSISNNADSLACTLGQ